ncbi:UDP-N-acetylmuramate dehydrogenase [Chromatium okenii]|uniref:UDP-N-acetylmuramate dehydrogenase n=1 Tax=Chromatium okenii TaxID=61644 RepID=UPI0026EECD6C|nr:UDP-N-acetylmuramate dehydrogenase [Chromatium okenii]MBV5311410.1 UDP-N-acetylmuramate dehydrogenase [Chromatium okenii]
MSTYSGILRHDEPLARYTTWRVGGPARQLYRPTDVADLAAFLRELPPAEPLLWLGLGSNVLIADSGFAGTVIHTLGGLTGLEQRGATGIVVDAGVPSAKLARFAAQHNLCGLEFLTGIPGTFGGALALNAGAWGGETWPHVRCVHTLDRHGTLRWREAAEFNVGYRQVSGAAGEWFVAAELELTPGDGAAALERMREMLERRAATQPIGQPSCGSVFRNPPNDHAARLIDTLGLKGYRIGGAQVSEKHANFIINTGSATAADISHLIDYVQQQVAQHTGIHLIPEVHQITGYSDDNHA